MSLKKKTSSDALQELLEEESVERKEISGIVYEKIYKSFLNPNMSLPDLDKITYRNFLVYADIDMQLARLHKTGILNTIADARELRENLDSILYGNVDLDVITLREIFNRLKVSNRDDVINSNKKLIKAYIIVIVEKLLASSPIVQPSRIQSKTPKEILASVEHKPDILTIIKADKDHFYVVGKTLPKYRRELLEMGGLVPKKKVYDNKKGKGRLVNRQNIIKFDNLHRKSVTKFIFTTLPNDIKAERLFYKYSKRKFKIYLDGALLYLKYHKGNSIINHKLIALSIIRLYQCVVPLEKLKEEESQILENTFTLNVDILKKLTDDSDITLTKEANSLLTSVVFYQTDIIGLPTKDNYDQLRNKLDRINEKVLKKPCPSPLGSLSGWLRCCASALYSSSRGFSPDGSLGARLIDYALAFIIGPKRRKSALEYTKQIRDESQKIKDDDLEKFFEEWNIFIDPVALSRSEKFTDKAALVTMAAGIYYLMQTIKKSSRIKLRIKALS